MLLRELFNLIEQYCSLEKWLNYKCLLIPLCTLYHVVCYVVLELCPRNEIYNGVPQLLMLSILRIKKKKVKLVFQPFLLFDVWLGRNKECLFYTSKISLVYIRVRNSIKVNMAEKNVSFSVDTYDF